MGWGENDPLEFYDVRMIELSNALQLSLDIFGDGLGVPRPELDGYLCARRC